MKIVGLLSIAILLGCCSQPSQSLRVLAIFPANAKSHFVVCEHVVKGLAAKGHQVDVYSHFPLKKPIPNYNDFSLKGTLPQYINNMNYSDAVTFQMINMGTLLKMMGHPLCELMELPLFQNLLKNPPKDRAYDVLLVEPFVSNCYLAWGRHLNIPIVNIIPSNILDWVHAPLGNPFFTAISPGMGFTGLHPMTFWQRLGNTLLHNLIVHSFNQEVRVQDKYVEKYFGQGYPNVVEMQKEIDLVLANTHHSLDGVRPLTPAIIPVAGVHISEDDPPLPKEVQKWLDESTKGCIYFTLGSMLRFETFPKNIIDMFYTSFEKIAPVRVLMKIAKPEELPSGLPKNVMTQTWFSQVHVLKHKNVKAFVTHGGMMSSLEAIQAAVPMVGIPVFGDQPTNVQLNVNKGIAQFIDLKDISEEKVTSALKAVLFDPKYQKNSQELAKRFLDRPMKPIDTAVYWIEYVVRHGKGSLRSPLSEMPWWQSSLLDIYSFLALALIIVLFILTRIVKIICRLFGCAGNKKVSKTALLKKKN
ncbi:hypothetical protein TKK_0007249 [Trichogramma kaykai]|uniref:UDP-glucuronosyltransferase n=1 Tax=Trichogramma kaykai TaxID=54128 RepID=A0ABD2X8W8_9HYME